jgi:2-amino-4-hydroxy-6-hydroxymethyldihydropteridine diphosphokinase
VSEVCYVGLGANLDSPAGAPHLTFAAAIARMPGEVEAVSPIYETAPVGPPQPVFTNAALRLRTPLAPLALLDALLGIERELGRDRNRETRWGPRSLDLDVLLWPGRALTQPRLRVPHPRLTERAFALAPLLDVLDRAAPSLPAGLPAELQAHLERAGGRPPLGPLQVPVTSTSGLRSGVVEQPNGGYPDAPRNSGAIAKS